MAPPRVGIRLTRAVFIAGAFALAACGGGSSESSTSSSSTIVFVPAPSTSPAGETTTSLESTTSTTAPSTSTTSASTTTPAPPDERPDGLVLLGDGLGPLAFGASPETAIEFLTAALGQPMADSGWTDPFSVYGTCPGTIVRGVEWPGFLALFGDAEDGYADGERHFMAWTVGWFGPDPFGMQTPAGAGIGTGRDRVAELYLAAVFHPADGPFPPSVVISTDRGDVFGSFDEDGSALVSLSAGTACGE